MHKMEKKIGIYWVIAIFLLRNDAFAEGMSNMGGFAQTWLMFIGIIVICSCALGLGITFFLYKKWKKKWILYISPVLILASGPIPFFTLVYLIEHKYIQF